MVSVSGAARVQSWEIATQRTPHVFSSPSLSPSFPSDSFPSHFLSSLPPRSGPQSAKSLGSAVTFPAGFDAEPGPRKSVCQPRKCVWWQRFWFFFSDQIRRFARLPPPHYPNFLLACIAMNAIIRAPGFPMVTPLVAVKMLQNTFSDRRVAM